MIFPKIIAYAWIFSVVFSVFLARGRGEPILNAFAPIKSFRAFCWQLAVAGVVCLLALWQLLDDPEVFGQQPMTWGSLMIMIYAWDCLRAYYKCRE